MALCLGGHAAVVSFELGRCLLAEIDTERAFPIEMTQMAER